MADVGHCSRTMALNFAVVFFQLISLSAMYRLIVRRLACQLLNKIILLFIRQYWWRTDAPCAIIISAPTKKTNPRKLTWKLKARRSRSASSICRGGRKVRLIDLPIPIRSSDCIGRYNRLIPSSDFWIGRLCRFVLSSDSLIARSCFLVLSSDFWIGRLCRFVLSSDSLIVRSCFLVLSSDFCIGQLCRFVLSSDSLIVRSCFLVSKFRFLYVRLCRPVLSNKRML